MSGDYERDTARLQLLLSGDSELGRSRAAWEEADRIARAIANRGGFVQIPEEVRDWLRDEIPSDERLEELDARPLKMSALPPRVRRWVEDSIVAMRERQRGE
jgi:hypothetical protein